MVEGTDKHPIRDYRKLSLPSWVVVSQYLADICRRTHLVRSVRMHTLQVDKRQLTQDSSEHS